MKTTPRSKLSILGPSETEETAHPILCGISPLAAVAWLAGRQVIQALINRISLAKSLQDLNKYPPNWTGAGDREVGAWCGDKSS